jgi:hypothetical protein
MSQHCHSRESGNPWPDISARDTILVRTKTRRRGATSLCLNVFVRTILPTGPPMRSRFLGNDTLWGARRGAEVAERRRNSSHRRSSGGWSLSRLAAGHCAGTIDGIGPSLRWGDGNLDSRTPIPQHCHSREGGNPWPDIAAHDRILVRTKTRRPGATSLCLNVFVRTILPTGPPMRFRFLGNDTLWGARRGAEVAERRRNSSHRRSSAGWSLSRLAG